MATAAVSPVPAAAPGEGPSLLVVVNGRASGVRDANATADEAVASLRAAGATDVAAVVTRTQDELATIAAVAHDRRLVLVGGDGALHAVANLATPLPDLALLPAGKANNIAHALGVPIEREAAARVAVDGVARPVDALRVETPERTVVAVEGVSAGFHAAARHRYTADNSAALGEGVRALVAELAAFHGHVARVGLDGVALHDGPLAQLFLSNLPRFGFGFEVDPMARADDGLLEAIVLRASTRTGVVRLLAAAHDGRHLDRPATTWASGAEARLDTPLPLVADAEPLGVTTARVAVLPGHLRVVVPAAGSPVLASPVPLREVA